MLTKSVALSKSNRTEPIERTFYSAAANLTTKVIVTSFFEPDLKWRGVVPPSTA